MKELLRVVEKSNNQYSVINASNESFIFPESIGEMQLEDVFYFIDEEQVSVYHHGSDHHFTFFVTNKCNSNCVMCPDSEAQRKVANKISTEQLYELLNILPKNIRTIDISGGEPTFLKRELTNFLIKIFEKYPYTHVMILSNGRSFADANFSGVFDQFKKRNLVIEIPIHAHNKKIHDEICGAEGGFIQTVHGICNLLDHGVRVNIRIVVSLMNYKNLNKIIDFISDNFENIGCINFMGMEMLGNAYLNKERVWIDFDEQKDCLESALDHCFGKTMIPQIYNYPLCLFEEKYWSFYKRSITPSKIRYLNRCEQCKNMDFCGGFFSSTILHTGF